MADLSFWEDADYVAPTYADRFLRDISQSPGIPSDGDVEAPTGWFCYLHIGSDDIAKWVSADGDPWMSERRNFAPGWYAIIVDHLGFVYGFCYGAGVKSEARVSADFGQAVEAYSKWSTTRVLPLHERTWLYNNLTELESVSKALRVELRNACDTGIDLSEDSLAWDAVGTIAGDLANVASILWPDSDGPIE